jgi:membrane protease YdiL (CAAX protease family)
LYGIERHKWRSLSSGKPISSTVWGLVAVLLLAQYPFIIYLQQLSEALPLPADWTQALKAQDASLEKIYKALTHLQGPGQLALGFIVIGVLAGLGEELTFRGLALPRVFNLTGNYHVAIWLVAFVFAAIHMQFYGTLSRMALGGLFGYLYYYSGNIWLPIAAHTFHNSFTLLMVSLYQGKVTTVDIDKPEVPWYLGLFSLGLMIVLLQRIKELLAPKTIANPMIPSAPAQPAEDIAPTWKRIYSTTLPYQAEIVKGMLEENGIAAVLMNKKDQSYKYGFMELLVHPDNVLAAIRLIQNTFDNLDGTAPDEPTNDAASPPNA